MSDLNPAGLAAACAAFDAAQSVNRKGTVSFDPMRAAIIAWELHKAKAATALVSVADVLAYMRAGGSADWFETIINIEGVVMQIGDERRSA